MSVPINELITFLAEHGLIAAMCIWLLFRIEKRIERLIDCQRKFNTIMSVLLKTVDPKPQDAVTLGLNTQEEEDEK